VAGFDAPVRRGGLVQRIPAVDDRSELAGLGQLGEDAEVRRLLAGRPEIGVRDDRALVADLCVRSICG
jgi:hypothetical protein